MGISKTVLVGLGLMLCFDIALGRKLLNVQEGPTTHQGMQILMNEDAVVVNMALKPDFDVSSLDVYARIHGGPAAQDLVISLSVSESKNDDTQRSPFFLSRSFFIERVIPLPSGIQLDPKRAASEYHENGVLSVTIPKVRLAEDSSPSSPNVPAMADTSSETRNKQKVHDSLDEAVEDYYKQLNDMHQRATRAMYAAFNAPAPRFVYVNIPAAPAVDSSQTAEASDGSAELQACRNLAGEAREECLELSIVELRKALRMSLGGPGLESRAVAQSNSPFYLRRDVIVGFVCGLLFVVCVEFLTTCVKTSAHLASEYQVIRDHTSASAEETAPLLNSGDLEAQDDHNDQNLAPDSIATPAQPAATSGTVAVVHATYPTPTNEAWADPAAWVAPPAPRPVSVA
mmetsp:Transcript_23619/g.40631  ORF Transcript_23619/g.40631 Transcript_23619/m.40631 type:complete len:400 (+) Transcript_23619:48-1247(+)